MSRSFSRRSFRWDIAISFAGEARGYATELYKDAATVLPRDRLMFDVAPHVKDVAAAQRASADILLAQQYRRSRLCVAIVSPQYGNNSNTCKEIAELREIQGPRLLVFAFDVERCNSLFKNQIAVELLPPAAQVSQENVRRMKVELLRRYEAVLRSDRA